MNAMDTEHHAKVAELNAQFQSQLQSLRSTLEQEHEQRIQELESQHSEAIAKVKAAKDQELEKLTQDHERLKAEHEEQLETLRADLEAAARADKQAALASLQEVMEEKVRLAESGTSKFKEMFYEESAARRQLHNRLVELQGNIRVFCRVRPVLEAEAQAARLVDFLSLLSMAC